MPWDISLSSLEMLSRTHTGTVCFLISQFVRQVDSWDGSSQMDGFWLGHPPLAPAALLFSCFRIWMVNPFNGIWRLNKEMLHGLSAWFQDAVDIGNSRCHSKDIPCHVFLLCLESKCQSSLFPNPWGSDLLHLATRDEAWQSGSHVARGLRPLMSILGSHTDSKANLLFREVTWLF